MRSDEVFWRTIHSPVTAGVSWRGFGPMWFGVLCGISMHPYYNTLKFGVTEQCFGIQMPSVTFGLRLLWLQLI